MGFRFLKSLDILGVVLCGRTKRMNRPEELEAVEHSLNLLSQVSRECILSVDDRQFPIFKKRFQSREIIIDSQNLHGPVSGILSVYSAYRVYNLIVLSMDMLHMEIQPIRTLIQNYKAQPNYDFYVFKNGKGVEPLCGIYTSAGLKKINDSYLEGSLKSYNLKTILQESNTLILEPPGEYEANLQHPVHKPKPLLPNLPLNETQA
ncbi:MAG: NTP transferase domain-containing protein [Leptospiraceae bacterium]|nr:NTP transferase domain-containing protein [Leptospiraceae bacterium]MCP5511494.1 NTP transferase domain-containing protein [Leptospiraceae bacterium]